MASFYNSRKEKLTGSPKVYVENFENEMKRASTPKPVSRSAEDAQPQPQQSQPVRKLAYKHDLEDLKKQIEPSQNVNRLFEEKVREILDTQELSLSSKIDDNKKLIDSLKVENLKNVLNDSINKMNEQLKNIAVQLISNNDKVGELRARLEEMENLF